MELPTDGFTTRNNVLFQDSESSSSSSNAATRMRTPYARYYVSSTKNTLGRKPRDSANSVNNSSNSDI